MSEIINQHALVSSKLGGLRFDQVAAICFPNYSRMRLQEWIKYGYLMVDGKNLKPKQKLCGGEQLTLSVAVVNEELCLAENVPLDVIYSDEDIIVLNKPAGLVVHPGSGNTSGTLMNGLLLHYPENASVPRAGIVHRLDKNTTGLMIVARNLRSHKTLISQIQKREICREYEGVIHGAIISGGTVNHPISRHPQNRVRMAVVPGGKPSVTHYRIHQRFRAHTHINIKLETGRTHQIRVHMSHLRYPLVGDSLYAGRLAIPANCTEILAQTLINFNRQALHAKRLGLIHPTTNKYMEWTSPAPNDFQNLLNSLVENDKIKNKISIGSCQRIAPVARTAKN